MKGTALALHARLPDVHGHVNVLYNICRSCAHKHLHKMFLQYHVVSKHFRFLNLVVQTLNSWKLFMLPMKMHKNCSS